MLNNSWKPRFRIGNEWCTTNFRFATREEALAYYSQNEDVDGYDAIESGEPVDSCFNANGVHEVLMFPPESPRPYLVVDNTTTEA